MVGHDELFEKRYEAAGVLEIGWSLIPNHSFRVADSPGATAPGLKFCGNTPFQSSIQPHVIRNEGRSRGQRATPAGQECRGEQTD
jgi:hypothetical protein